MNEALTRAAMKSRVFLSAQVEDQLTNMGAKASPLLRLLAIARERAADNIALLAYADASQSEQVRSLQVDIRCFDRIVEWLKQIVAEGVDADHQLDAIDRDDMLEVILGAAAEDAELPQHED